MFTYITKAAKWIKDQAVSAFNTIKDYLTTTDQSKGLDTVKVLGIMSIIACALCPILLPLFAMALTYVWFNSQYDQKSLKQIIIALWHGDKETWTQTGFWALLLVLTTFIVFI